MFMYGFLIIISNYCKVIVTVVTITCIGVTVTK